MFFWNSWFFDDPENVGNLISGSSALSKTSLNIWKFTVHILLKPSLENSLIAEEGFLISPGYSLELCILMGISFFFSFAFHSLLFSAIFKATSDSHFAFLHFFFLVMVLIPAHVQCHSTSGTLSIRANPLNPFLTSTV